MSEVVATAWEEAINDALKRLQESSQLGRNALINLLYDIHPATVFSRTVKTGSLVLERTRPPPPDETIQYLVEHGLPTPRELAELLPKVLPTPKQIVEAAVSAVDPASRVEKIGVAVLPVAILLSAIIVAIALALTR